MGGKFELNTIKNMIWQESKKKVEYIRKTKRNIMKTHHCQVCHKQRDFPLTMDLTFTEATDNSARYDMHSLANNGKGIVHLTMKITRSH